MEEAMRCYREALADDPQQSSAKERLQALTAFAEKKVCSVANISDSTSAPITCTHVVIVYNTLHIVFCYFVSFLFYTILGTSPDCTL